MTKWEYKELYYNGKYYIFDGEYIQNGEWALIVLFPVLNLLGQQGWELVAVNCYDEDKKCYIMKRELE